MIAVLSKGSGGKKFKVKLYKSGELVKTLQFGDSRYEDYTIHKDDDRKRLYKLRHSNENWEDPLTKGFWSKHLLWNKKTLGKSIADLEENYNIMVIVN